MAAGAHLGLGAQQHRDDAARLEAGAAADCALVDDNDALHALLDEMEGGAEAGHSGTDYDYGLRSLGWHGGFILWLNRRRHKGPRESTAEHAENAEGEGLCGQVDVACPSAGLWLTLEARPRL